MPRMDVRTLAACAMVAYLLFVIPLGASRRRAAVQGALPPRLVMYRMTALSLLLLGAMGAVADAAIGWPALAAARRVGSIPAGLAWAVATLAASIGVAFASLQFMRARGMRESATLAHIL